MHEAGAEAPQAAALAAAGIGVVGALRVGAAIVGVVVVGFAEEVEEAGLGAVDPVAARAREAGDRPSLVGGVEAAEAAGTGEFGRCGHGQGATV